MLFRSHPCLLQNDPEIKRGVAQSLFALGVDLLSGEDKDENRDEILRKIEEGVSILRDLDQNKWEPRHELILYLGFLADTLNEFELYDQEQEVRREREELLKSLPELALNK